MASTAHDGRKSRRSFTNLLTCRQILNIMVITGFMFNYMLRVNITIALVEMVYNDTNTTNDDTTVNMRNTTEIRNTGTKYNWDKHATGQIIGSFFWGYILTELPGGRLSEVIGARKVLGFGMGLASIITLFMPMLCNTGYVVVSVFRALVGFCLGASFPALPPLGAKWIPPLERSKFMANLMASALGAAVTMPICGYLIDSLGWESVFYVTGGVGLIWTFVWFALVYDSPAQHPRISDEERNEIEAKIKDGQGSGIKPKHVPWRSFLTSLPVWSIAITHACSVYGYFTLVNQLPLFMKEVYNVSIKKNGFFSSFPYCAKYVMAVLSSWVADRMRKTGKYSTTFIRKSFTLFAVLSPAVCMAIEAIWHINENFSIAIFTLTLFFNGAVVGGYFSNPLDIAPNFSGTIMGLANTFSSLGGWVSATVVAEITSKNGTIEQWKYIFWMLVVVYICGALSFTIFGTGDLQSWNSIKRQSSSITDIKITEMRPLNSTNNKS
ncbi:hypothetical protein RI129_010523 [Pyrocoelia pectoralis]|uniref:Major facilitator superfamily (MFS) profile domain-containing protein n=1 Tax=Pyrocoelia pectoralis TaxID=417401 RepID=A0AAN7ZK36_9COLE